MLEHAVDGQALSPRYPVICFGQKADNLGKVLVTFLEGQGHGAGV